MKNNKLICVILALLVCLSMVVSASATEEANVIFALKSADFSVEGLEPAVVGAGEEKFVVTVDIVKNDGFKNAMFYFEYNEEELELVSVKSLDEENVQVYDFGKIYINSSSDVNDPGEAYTATGSVAELTFKVKVETDEQISIALKVSQKNVTNADGKANVLTVAGEELLVNVKSEDHKCDENNTVEADNRDEPTCTEAGKAADLLCAHCGETVIVGEEIAATGHAWGEYVVTTAPTCNAFGVQTRTCATCGETETDSSVPKTEHTFGEWKVTTEPTTEAEGVETRTCSGCGEAETRPVEKLSAPVEQPKNNTALIVIIVVAVLAGAGVAAFFVLKNKKK